MNYNHFEYNANKPEDMANIRITQQIIKLEHMFFNHMFKPLAWGTNPVRSKSLTADEAFITPRISNIMSYVSIAI